MAETLMINPAEMERLATVFNQQAEAVASIMSTIDATLAGTTWVGGRARQFEQNWNGAFKRNLVALQTALVENGSVINRESAAGRAALDL
ncbi:MAG: WXG100 family type VII secretion target [Actinomycetota bacterium]